MKRSPWFLPFGKADDTASSALPRVRGNLLYYSFTLERLEAAAFLTFATIVTSLSACPYLSL